MPATRLLSAMVATWNNVATTFTGLKLNVTDTASASGSLLMDLQVGGASKFSVPKTGEVISASDFWVRSNAANAGVYWGSSGDVFLTRDAANTLALRNGTAAQKLSVYNTYTDASNYERGVFDWAGTANTLRIGTEAAGTGTVRNIQLVAGSNSVTMTPGASNLLTLNGGLTTGGSINVPTTNSFAWVGQSKIINISDGALQFQNNAGTNTFTLTASGGGSATFGGGLTATLDLYAGATRNIAWSSRSVMKSSASGIVSLLNVGETDFTRLILGTNDTSGVAIKKSGTTINLVLGDDSGRANLTAGIIATTNSTVAGLPSAAGAGTGARSFVTDANATMAAGVGTAVVGGGANKVPVYSDGTDWLIG